MYKVKRGVLEETIAIIFLYSIILTWNGAKTRVTIGVTVILLLPVKYTKVHIMLKTCDADNNISWKMI